MPDSDSRSNINMSDKLDESVGSNVQHGHEEIKNNNRCIEDSLNGDTNGNKVHSKDSRTLEDTGTLLSFQISQIEEQDKVIIWGTDSQYDDPELAEFEMLECQELEAYLVESGDSNVKQERAIPGTNKILQAEIGVEKGLKNKVSKPEKRVQETTTFKVINKDTEACVSKTENSSENDVFVSCYSTMSSLASQSCLTSSDKSKHFPHTDGTHVDLNLNNTSSEEPILEAQETQPVQMPDQLKNTVTNCNGSFKNSKDEHNDLEYASKDNAGHLVDAAQGHQILIREEHELPDAKTITPQQKSDDMHNKIAQDVSEELKGNQFQREASSDSVLKSSTPDSTETPSQCAVSEARLYQKQAFLERTRNASPSSIEGRAPWCSSPRPATPPSSNHTGSPRRQSPSSPARTISTKNPAHDPSGSPQRFTSGLKPPSKSYFSSGIPKPIPPQQPSTETESLKSSSPQKPKNIRPKIITYVRRSSPVKPHTTESPYEASTLPFRITPSSSTSTTTDQKVGRSRGSPELSSYTGPYDKFGQETQKSGCYNPSPVMVSGIRPSSQTVPHKMVGKSESFHEELRDTYLKEVGKSVQVGAYEIAGVYRSPRALKPQLGLGAVTRQPTTRNRMMMPAQRSISPLSHSASVVQPAYYCQEPTGDLKKPLQEVAPKSFLPKSGQSGLCPPGFSHLPAARLTAFGFVRSASVSSTSSSYSNDGRPPNASRKELQRDGNVTQPPLSSPKRFAVVSPKPQSPVRQKSCVARLGGRMEWADAERERLAVQRLRERCDDQAKQIISLQTQLGKNSLCTVVLAITTQHFCKKSEDGVLKERELSLELSRIRDEVVDSVGRWKQLLGEKAELERSFEQQLKELKEKQQKDLQDLEKRLTEEQQKETERLQQQQSNQLQQLRSQHQQQVEEMSENHEAAIQEMEAAHNATLATLLDEHARTVKNLKMAHEQQKKSLEEDFEKLRLSLQDQVDTLTFQNRSLRDRAKRFEEALRRSTDEQTVEALAPYQHIEEDLKSLKEVVEMKNQQIHQQEVKISELEKLAQKNVMLEERVQVLQQQNEDLKARIDLNLAVSRQLSEDNANLQEYVEKESNEKKRLSRTNEELLWRLQTGELSPRMSPNQSPLHRSSSGAGSPSHLPPFPR
ncbi:microtubule-associated tumor suppressor candidate 2 [Trichomycterus rosablanca]|uniref:microtubule-associated tumor suppressor candidate 2 n=1 Tax=Trichomycterus rosablanca TaxID=2290929 RepID=UPI002F358B11